MLRAGNSDFEVTTCNRVDMHAKLMCDMVPLTDPTSAAVACYHGKHQQGVQQQVQWVLPDDVVL